MSMKVTRLYTHWSPDEAHTIIEFLDHLRDQLVESYGDEIANYMREACAAQNLDERQSKLEFGDNEEF